MKLTKLVYVLCLLLAAGCGPAKDDKPPATPPLPAGEATAQGVILLTGFEPFGPKKSPNPSWEAIAALDGRSWKGYQLVCKQMKVVWGAPLQQLQAWITEYKPVAVFSFGQGRPGGFSLESKALNQRSARLLDNNSAPPPTAAIVDGGPAEFQATIACAELAARLSKQGYQVRVSKDAGAYLCEETLYTLEYLKTKHPLQTVSFCHVPPLGTLLDGKPVTATRVQLFVEDLLEALAPSITRARRPRARPLLTRAAEVEALVKHYFASWSDHDIKAYGECFADNACVQFIDSDGSLTTSALGPFLAGQAEVQRISPDRQTETPESIDIRFEWKLAHAVVYWKLTAGTRTEYGYDHFTLMKYGGKWRIIHLVFYATKRSG